MTDATQTPSPLYIPFQGLQTYFVNKLDGSPLSQGKVKFFKDNNRTVSKDVFQQVLQADGSYHFVDIGSEITLSNVGTFADINGNDIQVYAFPYTGNEDAPGTVELYFIEIYAADPPISTGALQFTREAQPPNVVIDENPIDIFESTDNELSNPQFVEISFVPDPVTTAAVFNVSGTNQETEIAPGWTIVTTGTGSVTVKQVAIVDNTIPSNPPYAIDINSAGITDIYLRQRLEASPRLLLNGFISGYFLAANVGSATQLLFQMEYVPSQATAQTFLICQGTNAPNTKLTPISGTVATTPNPLFYNHNPAPAGYVDIEIIFPALTHVQISSVQITGVQNENSSVEFLEQSTNRQIDHLFHYYKDSILLQPKESILTGWVFGLNPFQFRDFTPANLADNAYVCDQTIAVQQNYVASATGNNILIGQGTAANNYPLNVQAVTVNNKFAIVQYIDPYDLYALWGNNLSAMVRAKITTSNASNIRFKMQLYYKPTLPNKVAQNDPIASWLPAAGAEPSFSGGWIKIQAFSDPVYYLTSSYQNFIFNQFTLPALAGADQTLAVVIYTIDSMVSTGTADSIQIDTVSLIPNDFALDATPLTFDETLERCQYYYEKSYPIGVLPGTITNENAKYIAMPSLFGTLNHQAYPTVFEINYQTIKRAIPKIVSIFNPATGAGGPVGTTAQVRVRAFAINVGGSGATIGTADTLISSGWNTLSSSTKRYTFDASTTLPLIINTAAGLTVSRASAGINYHYAVDARMGIEPPP